MESPKPISVFEAIRPRWWQLMFAFFGLLTFCWGLISLIFGFDYSLTLMLVGLFLWAPLIGERIKQKHFNQLAQINLAKLREEEELKHIKKTMTPAEWELYKVQRENQKLLRQMNAKPAQPSGPKPMFGITNELSDE